MTEKAAKYFLSDGIRKCLFPPTDNEKSCGKAFYSTVNAKNKRLSRMS